MLKSALGAVVPRKRGSGRGRDTKSEILDAAEELLQRRGFNAFSYHHIAVRLGVRHAAVHYHFPAKEDLGVALIRRYRERFRQWRGDVESLPNSWDRLQEYFKTFLGFLEADCRCCPGGVLAAEYDALPDAMRDESRDLMRENYRWLSTTLEQGRREGVLRFNGEPADKAAEVAAALQGGLQIARLAGRDRFHQVLKQLAGELTGRDDYAVPAAA